MPHLTTQILVSLLIPLLTRSTPLETSQYLSMRDDLIAEDEHMRLGGHLVLSVQEQRMNEIFMKEKRAMIQTSRTNRSVFVPSTSFYHSRRLIEETPLFEKIHQMPKGAALHIHDMSMVSLDWLVTNVTYRDNVYMCPLANGYLNFQVFNSSYQTPDCLWKLVKNERAASGNVTAFDLNLKNNLTLMGSDPFLTFADNQAAWVRFGLFFRQVSNLLYHVPIYRDMLWQTLTEFRDANVQYLEIRGSFDQMFDLDGTRHDTEFGVLLVKQVADQFVKTYPDFSGVKVILSGIRNRNSSVILEEVKTAMELHKKYPEVVAGYDMSGNEALYNPLSYYSEALLYPSRQDPPYKLPYFLHAGETPWQGTETGFNIADAILLNATRIGHGYALGKHPKFLQKVKEQNIAVEVQPISNQVLRLINDFRNHPMAALMANNLSVVISSDDRTTFDAAPLSHDFYVVFLAMSSEMADLTLLKQLAINSIKYSSLDPARKEAAMKLWQTKWDTFVGEPPTSAAPVRASTTKQNNGASGLLAPWTSFFLGTKLVVYLGISRLSTL